MKKEMLINTVAGQECRIAIVEDGKLEELYTERASSASRVGNIYKAKIMNVEPSIQAAFVDFGKTKNGFLHISDVHPQYFPGKKQTTESVGRKHPHRHRPPIQECFKRGQSVVVQMTKEGIGTKGPTMTTYLSIPGRMLVLMPSMSRLGVSRKVEDPEARAKARQVLSELKLPADMGFIVRTAGVGRSKRDLQRDLNYLLRLWKTIKKRINAAKAPAEIYEESDLVTRTIRDVYNTDIKRIICDDQHIAANAKEFLDVAMPRTKHKVELYQGREGLFHDAGLEAEIERIYARRVEMPSGGSLVIDQTEALVAIDVNSGRFREHRDAETTALKINQKAAEEIARQLRLRDLGGVIIIDFIDMREAKNRRAVEKTLKDAMKPDRAKSKVARISTFGIVEMTRQRMRPSLKQSIYRHCEHCDGLGLVKSEESQALLIMRMLQRAVSHHDVTKAEARVTPTVAHRLNNFHREGISRLERSHEAKIMIVADDGCIGDEWQLTATNARGNEVAWDSPLIEQDSAGKLKTIGVLEAMEQQAQAAEQARPVEEAAKTEQEEKPKKSRGRRRRKKKPDEQQEEGKQAQPEKKAESTEPSGEQAATSEGKDKDQKQPDQGQKPKKRRRGRRGGRKHRKKNSGNNEGQAQDKSQQQKPVDQNAGAEPSPKQGEPSPAKEKPSEKTPPRRQEQDEPVESADAKNQEQKKPKRSRRRKKPQPKPEETSTPGEAAKAQDAIVDKEESQGRPDEDKPKKQSRRRRKKTTKQPEPEKVEAAASDSDSGGPQGENE